MIGVEIIHLALHFIVPAFIAGAFFRSNRKSAFLTMIATLLVDLDHLLANPIYDPGRCSIGTHPLHGLFPIALYVMFCFIPKTRYIGIGLVTHMLLDSMDCRLTNGVWAVGSAFGFI